MLTEHDINLLTVRLTRGDALDNDEARALLDAFIGERAAHLRTRAKLSRTRDALSGIQGMATRAVRIDQERQLAEDLGPLTPDRDG